jgi:hypothetical protein
MPCAAAILVQRFLDELSHVAEVLELAVVVALVRFFAHSYDFLTLVFFHVAVSELRLDLVEVLLLGLADFTLSHILFNLIISTPLDLKQITQIFTTMRSDQTRLI